MYDHALETKKLLVKKTAQEINGRNCIQKKDDVILIL